MILKDIIKHNLCSKLGLQVLSDKVYLKGNILFYNKYCYYPTVYVVKDLNVDLTNCSFYSDNFLRVFEEYDITKPGAELPDSDARWVENGPWVDVIESFTQSALWLIAAAVKQEKLEADERIRKQKEDADKIREEKLSSFSALFPS